MRIQKYLSQQGLCSRRQAEAFIAQGLVTVNGVVVREQGVQIDPERDVVTLGTKASDQLERTETVAVYKPRGIVSTRELSGEKNIFDLLPQYAHLHVIGRLDKESEGLLLLSNDGPLARAITGDDHRTEKEYLVTVREHVSDSKISQLTRSIELEDGPTLPATVKWEGPHRFRIMLHEGRKHEIRRMCNYLHYTVESLKRVRIGTLAVQDLKPGHYRPLSQEEVATLCNQEEEYPRVPRSKPRRNY